MGLYKTSIALFLFIEALFLILFIKVRNKKILIFIILFLVSFCYAKIIDTNYDNAFKIKESAYIVKLQSLKEETKNSNRYIGKIKFGKYKNFKIYIYTKEKLEFGDIIKFSGDIEKPDEVRNDKRL